MSPVDTHEEWRNARELTVKRMKYTGYAIVIADPVVGESLPPKVLDMMFHGWQPIGGAFYVPNASDPTKQGLICQTLVS